MKKTDTPTTEVIEVPIDEKKEQSPTPPSLVNNADTDPSERYDDVYTDYIPNTIVSAEKEKKFYQFACQNKITLRVYILTNRIIRFRYALKGKFEKDFSYAINPAFKAKKVKSAFIELDQFYIIKTKELICKINKSNLSITIENKEGKTLSKNARFSARSTILKGLMDVRMTKKAFAKEQFLGLGDKSSSLNLRGETCVNWNTDSFAYGEGSYQLYRTIPFYYSLNKGLAYGIFMDNSHHSTFDFDSATKGETSFFTNGGEMNYYFIYGPELLSITQQYHQLTGVPELPPMWALGFHQCRWSYYPESRVREVAAEFRKREIPCDAIYLDIDYMDGYRCFTWNKKYFPDLKKMSDDLMDDGFSTIVMIDPGIKEDEDYFVYKDGIEKDMFCFRSDGNVMVGPVWPDECVFPDYTKPEVRDWWADLYEELYAKEGIAGFWNDMNEPAVFKVHAKTFPDDVLHDYDGQGGNHKKAHNIYGMQMTRATLAGLKKFQSEQRPFVLTRATYSGGQRYAAVWTGDNVATWEHLRLANRQCQRLSLSGFSFVGTDIGGFVDSPSPELMTRWVQMGIFHPFYRIHSMGNNVDGAAEVHDDVKAQEQNNRQDQEPWSFGEETAQYCKTAIELRYRLLPYLYTAFHENVKEGLPILQSLTFYDQTDKKLHGVERDFLFGKNILVSPVVEEGTKKQKVYLPKGDWYDFNTGKKYAGQKTASIKTPIDQIPFFVKAGTVLPLHPIRQHTKAPLEVLHLHIYPGNNTSQLYEDAGQGYDYQNGDYRLTIFESKLTAKQLTITTSIEGNYKAEYKSIQLHLHGINAKSISIGGKKVDSLEIKNMFKTLKIKI